MATPSGTLWIEMETVYTMVSVGTVNGTPPARLSFATFDFDGPKRGIVVTTGRFTNLAQEYAN